ncbi:tubulin binding cofactor C-domain-containing protein [Mrakia frigida]|uniref:tubulin binding cofactor C-domain-containing protein n=1 Tax=Mrakia frigida TaxID=29902 RepID=UPI003FCC1E79
MTSQERSASYLTSFQVSAAALTSRLDPKQESWSPTEISLELAKLKRGLIEAAEFLPRYDQRKLESEIKDLEATFDARKAVSAPKSRFSFKKASPRTPSPSTPPPPPPPPAVLQPPSTSSRSPNDISISHLSNQVVNLPPLPSSSTSSGFGLDLENLTRCIVDLRPLSTDSRTSLTALHAKNLKECLVLAPLVGGSVMLSGCDGCLIVLGGWQFRMHSSHGTDIFLYTSSDSSTPIIESCSDIKFGPYILEHDQNITGELVAPQVS